MNNAKRLFCKKLAEKGSHSFVFTSFAQVGLFRKYFAELSFILLNEIGTVEFVNLNIVQVFPSSRKISVPMIFKKWLLGGSVSQRFTET